MIETSLTDPGEQLIWSGNPDPARYALRQGTRLFLFGITNVGFFLFWIYTFPQIDPADMPFGLPIWAPAAPILLFGACLMLVPAWHFFRGMRTAYALTDRRAITDVSGLFPRRISVPLSQISFVDVQSSGEGPGHVLFQEAAPSSSSFGKPQRDGFIAVADATKVGYLLRGAIEKSGSSRIGKS